MGNRKCFSLFSPHCSPPNKLYCYFYKKKKKERKCTCDKGFQLRETRFLCWNLEKLVCPKPQQHKNVFRGKMLKWFVIGPLCISVTNIWLSSPQNHLTLILQVLNEPRSIGGCSVEVSA
jgi:hypothetical protein